MELLVGNMPSRAFAPDTPKLLREMPSAAVAPSIDKLLHEMPCAPIAPGIATAPDTMQLPREMPSAAIAPSITGTPRDAGRSQRAVHHDPQARQRLDLKVNKQLLTKAVLKARKKVCRAPAWCRHGN